MPALYAGIVALGMLGAVSDATLNQWAQSSRWPWLLLSYGLWGAVATLFGLMLKGEHVNFGVLVVVFLMANSAFAVLLDRVVFHGTISAAQWLGLGFALVAVVLFEWGRVSSAT